MRPMEHHRARKLDQRAAGQPVGPVCGLPQVANQQSEQMLLRSAKGWKSGIKRPALREHLASRRAGLWLVGRGPPMGVGVRAVVANLTVANAEQVRHVAAAEGGVQALNQGDVFVQGETSCSEDAELFHSVSNGCKPKGKGFATVWKPCGSEPR